MQLVRALSFLHNLKRRYHKRILRSEIGFDKSFKEIRERCFEPTKYDILTAKINSQRSACSLDRTELFLNETVIFSKILGIEK